MVSEIIGKINMLTTTKITAKQLKIGDKVLYFTGDIWEIVSKPKSSRQGLSFQVFNCTRKTHQNVKFAPNWRFELVS